MTVNFCSFKIRITNSMTRTLVFRWSIQWSLATQSLTQLRGAEAEVLRTEDSGQCNREQN